MESAIEERAVGKVRAHPETQRVMTKSVMLWFERLAQMRENGVVVHFRHSPVRKAIRDGVVEILKHFGVTKFVKWKKRAGYNDPKYVPVFISTLPPVVNNALWMNTECTMRRLPEGNVLACHFDMNVVRESCAAGVPTIWFPSAWCKVPRSRRTRPGRSDVVAFAGSFSGPKRAAMAADMERRTDVNLHHIYGNLPETIADIVVRDDIGLMLEISGEQNRCFSPARFSAACGPGTPLMGYGSLRMHGGYGEWSRILPAVDMYPIERTPSTAEHAARCALSLKWWAEVDAVGGEGAYLADVARAAHLFMLQGAPQETPVTPVVRVYHLGTGRLPDKPGRFDLFVADNMRSRHKRAVVNAFMDRFPHATVGVLHENARRTFFSDIIVADTFETLLQQMIEHAHHKRLA